MPKRHDNQKEKYIKILVTYGFHLAMLIFIANVAIFLTFSYFTRASTNTASESAVPIIPDTSDKPETTELPISPTITDKPTPTPTPLGPVAKISFTLPGIGTRSGNMKPLHKTKDFTLSFYKPDLNTADRRVKPEIVIKGKATYDENPDSPTYAAFVNKHMDLGPDVGGGKYQITLKASQTLSMLIRNPSSKSKGGEIYSPSKGLPLKLPWLDLISGDIYPVPESDNIMDINDYNMLKNCFSIRASTTRCISGSMADLDDNGVIDGIDYNILLNSYRTLLTSGIKIPSIILSNKIVINPVRPQITLPINLQKKDNKISTSSPTELKSTNKGGGGAIFFVILIILLVLIIGGILVFLKFRKGKGVSDTNSQNQMQGQAQTGDVTEQATVEAISTNEEAQDEQAAENSVANSTEQQTPAQDTPTQGEVSGSTQTINSMPAGANNNGEIEKTGYLKKVKEDAGMKGVWVTIADDNEIIAGLYQGSKLIEGFVRARGIMKKDQDNKEYLLISDLNEDQ